MTPTNLRFGAGIMAALLVLSLAQTFSDPKLYVQAAIAFAAAFWQLRPPYTSSEFEETEPTAGPLQEAAHNPKGKTSEGPPNRS